ncbi:MAG: sensor histidine kinase, partial [Cyclobacteriaceae bacterium]
GIINVLNINDDPKLLNDYIFHIKTKASQLDNTIQSLVELIKSSRERLTFEKINIEELIESIVLKLSNRENFDNLNIIINNISTDCDFYSNKFRVKIIIKAIISNAIQFQAQNKDDQNKLTIDIKINREKIIMKFWDNGTGIPPQIIDKVNGMFFRGSFQSKGAGMGLYITDKIVKVLEGEMVIESKEGEWTHVILKLPNRNPS